MKIGYYNGFKVLDQTYEEYMRSDAWKKVRLRRIRMDGYRCHRCYKRFAESELQVHHLTYARFGNENFRTDLVTLCKACHAEVEQSKADAKENAYSRLQKLTEWTEQFCHFARYYDRLSGGTMNLCDLGDIRYLAGCYGNVPLNFAPSRVLEHFRSQRWLLIHRAMLEGYSTAQMARLWNMDYHYANKRVKKELEGNIMAKLNQYNGFDTSTESTSGSRAQLPVGAYIGKIVKTRLVEDKNYLEMLIEVTEGEHKGFYKKDFEAQKGGKFEAKYKGRMIYYVPKNDGSELDKLTISKFNGMLAAVEHSNDGYKWNWDTDSLAGRKIGFIVREAEFNGNVFTEPGMIISVGRVEKGDWTEMKRRVPKGEASAANAANAAPSTGAFADSDTDDDLPF